MDRAKSINTLSVTEHHEYNKEIYFATSLRKQLSASKTLFKWALTMPPSSIYKNTVFNNIFVLKKGICDPKRSFKAF